MREKRPIIIIGNGGHAKVLTEILLLNNENIIGFTTPQKEENPFGLNYLGNDSVIFHHLPSDVHLVNGLGSTHSTLVRKKIYQTFSSAGYMFAQVIHPSALVSAYSRLGEGVQIMARAVIQPFAQIADNTIINTVVSIDHDCVIGAHCHIAPGSILSGNVQVGHETHIGTGTTVIQGVKIGSQVLIGAGSLVLKDVKDQTTVYGTPAKEVRK
ncbi:sugar acetyltransferase [Bacillaceae bacterium SAS-127]|nr:sugar acetyltransferase [Bacillaceae bacterium SAS-127]